ncbi:MAG: transglutaminase-like domain-containing protein, partial [Longimicrobiales bacterium]|nr:transglutaminase-like domain-containing protein [Longimicrobiales bacterium]
MSIGRKTLAVVILLTWVVLAGWKVRREYFQPELARIAEAALSLAPGVEFYQLSMGERTVGLATSRLDTVPDGFLLEDFLSLELPALGQEGTAVTRTRVALSPALVMEEFSFLLDSEVGTFEASGSVAGDTLLTARVDAGGSTQELSFRLERPPVFAAALPIRVAAGGSLAVGEELEFPIFDPSTLSTRTVEVRVLEHDTLVVPDSAVLDPSTGRWSVARYDSVPSWKIAEVLGGVELESWVDEDGRVVRASSPMGFSMERTEYELARQAQEDARGLASSPVDEDVILSTAVQSNVDLGAVEEHEELRFRLSGVDLEGFDLEGGRQELRGDTLIVRRENLDAVEAGYALPYPRMDLRETLQPEPLIQSDNEEIARRARQMVGWRPRDERDPEVVADRLTRGIYETLEKRITFSVPSALQVLESGQGDCNEHTVLYVAMARALGLPARTAVGLVYLDGSFFYHAWPEVWLGEWVAVDPTFGQVPADAAHIRFIIGGLAQQVEIVRLIGRLQIEV